MKEKYAKRLNIGLHINLSIGKPVLTGNTYLTQKNGQFRFSFTSLLFLPFLKNKAAVMEEVRNEIEVQIQTLLSNDISITHIDSHRHVHTIPWIFKIVKELAVKYRIPRVRVINESFVHTVLGNLNQLPNPLNMIKYGLLKLFFYINKIKSSVYFFSILHSCAITYKHIMSLKIPDGYESLEVMLHPGMPEIDQYHLNESIIRLEKKQLLSAMREAEMKSALTFSFKKFKKKKERYFD